jgi:DNA (cytosine-5)-methyltransferase 1
VDGAHFVPQHRERILIVGFRERVDFTFDDMRLPELKSKMASILHPQDGSELPEAHYTVGPKAKVDERYTLTPKLWAYLQAYAEKHRTAGNGFGFGLVNGDSVARTLSARYYKDGSEILVAQGKRKNPRRLTPRECARLMGFPDDFIIPVSDTQAYKQFGNSVVVPVMREIARVMKPRILEIIDPELARQKSLLAA